MFNSKIIKELEFRIERLERESLCNQGSHDWAYFPKRDFGYDFSGHKTIIEEGVYCNNCNKSKIGKK